MIQLTTQIIIVLYIWITLVYGCASAGYEKSSYNIICC